MQVSDAVKHFSGVTVKDYGGIGGLKTVSIRSLGAQHTVVGYDGIAVTDCQTGQVDIGRFSLENVDRLMLSNGQSDQIFSLHVFRFSWNFEYPDTYSCFQNNKSVNLNASVKSGSWGLVNPSVLYEQKLGENGH